MCLTAAEREAVLTYDEVSNIYHIFCSSGKEQTRMKRAGFVPYKTDAEGNTYYKVERKQISFRAKSKPRHLTDEQRLKRSERFKQMHQKNQNAQGEIL
ncbi:hypothetical protein NV379_02040 [Paenibacillus sp. N1-5-1-14]|uniref:hypothetical protein n=1 Tax=Paenibacillus radicibacter TaxID=2972488 RepID=UPI0021597667|nr:hypothetical protein [Paenibacillus radicibacter]MCR8641426.1 hypothetical protein [Paenibacillus radicibacter]